MTPSTGDVVIVLSYSVVNRATNSWWDTSPRQVGLCVNRRNIHCNVLLGGVVYEVPNVHLKVIR